MTFLSKQCPTCTHWHKGELTCDAFPDEIPYEILTGEFIHDRPHPNQKNSVVYKTIR